MRSCQVLCSTNRSCLGCELQMWDTAEGAQKMGRFIYNKPSQRAFKPGKAPIQRMLRQPQQETQVAFIE